MSAKASITRRDAEQAARLRLIVTRLARAVRQHGAGGLTPSQLSALATLEDAVPVRVSELAVRESVAPPVMTRVVDSLEKLGLVTRRHDDADGRVCLVELTTAGYDTLAAVWGERTAGLAQRVAGLAPEQRAALDAALPALEALARDDPRDG